MESIIFWGREHGLAESPVEIGIDIQRFRQQNPVFGAGNFTGTELGQMVGDELCVQQDIAAGA